MRLLPKALCIGTRPLSRAHGVNRGFWRTGLCHFVWYKCIVNFLRVSQKRIKVCTVLSCRWPALMESILPLATCHCTFYCHYCFIVLSPVPVITGNGSQSMTLYTLVCKSLISIVSSAGSRYSNVMRYSAGSRQRHLSNMV